MISPAAQFKEQCERYSEIWTKKKELARDVIAKCHEIQAFLSKPLNQVIATNLKTEEQFSIFLNTYSHKHWFRSMNKKQKDFLMRLHKFHHNQGRGGAVGRLWAYIQNQELPSMGELSENTNVRSITSRTRNVLQQQLEDLKKGDIVSFEREMNAQQGLWNTNDNQLGRRAFIKGSAAATVGTLLGANAEAEEETLRNQASKAGFEIRKTTQIIPDAKLTVIFIQERHEWEYREAMLKKAIPFLKAIKPIGIGLEGIPLGKEMETYRDIHTIIHRDEKTPLTICGAKVRKFSTAVKESILPLEDLENSFRKAIEQTTKKDIGFMENIKNDLNINIGNFDDFTFSQLLRGENPQVFAPGFELFKRLTSLRTLCFGLENEKEYRKGVKVALLPLYLEFRNDILKTGKHSPLDVNNAKKLDQEIAALPPEVRKKYFPNKIISAAELVGNVDEEIRNVLSAVNKEIAVLSKVMKVNPNTITPTPRFTLACVSRYLSERSTTWIDNIQKKCNGRTGVVALFGGYKHETSIAAECKKQKISLLSLK
tara:strand:+ start:19 stop:1638 length:1620 start_codon:yes stop_codon:yes gene_type:complete